MTDQKARIFPLAVHSRGGSAAVTEVISVDLVWESMEFIYTGKSNGTWNPETHQYEGEAAGGWSARRGTDPKITVKNHSNVAVEINFVFTPAVEGLNCDFAKNTLMLATAEGTEVDNAPQDETTVSISGSGIDATKSIGTVTVTVGEAYTLVSTEDELNQAMSAGKTKIRLKNDITMTAQPKWFDLAGDRVIDLNGYTLVAHSSGPIAAAPVHVNQNCTMTIRNGTIRAASNADENVEAYAVAVGCYCGGILTLESCTLESYSSYALQLVGGTVTLKNCTIISRFSGGAIKSENDSRLTFSGSTTITCNAATWIIVDDTSSGNTAITVCLPGTYNFDPTGYVDTVLYDIIANTEAGTWTVTAK